jgi:transcription initiation factor IIE alpha subunit
MIGKPVYDLVCSDDNCEYGVNNAHGLTANEEEVNCPKCGKRMVTRDSKRKRRR